MDQQTKIIHVDMDYFYAQVEVRDNPRLKNKPVIISGPPNTRGSVICTASYEAREHGIHAGMSATRAFQILPKIIYILPDFEKYASVSKQMHAIFKRYSDIIEPLSLDEAYIDVTNNKLGIKSATTIAQYIQRDIKKELNLTCSVGVSYNKFLAKIGSDYVKPNGITVISPKSSKEFVKILDINKFPMVGKKSLKKYYEYGIYKGNDLLEFSEKDLIKMFGKIGTSLYNKARGIGSAEVIVERDRKSYGKETTLRYDINTKEELYVYLLEISEHINSLLHKDNKIGFTINLKLRFSSDFRTITRSKTFSAPLRTSKKIYDEACRLLHLNYNKEEIRLIGISISNVKENTNEVYYEQIYLKLY